MLLASKASLNLPGGMQEEREIRTKKDVIYFFIKYFIYFI
jgi:hypothetical protein